MSVKKGDLVEVISGKDKGTQAHVLRAFPSEGKVTVEGVAVAKKAQKPTRTQAFPPLTSRAASSRRRPRSTPPT